MQKPFSHTMKYEEKEGESGWVSLILTASGAVGGQTFSFLYCSRDVYSQGRLSSDVGRGFALFSRKRVFTRHILPPRHVSNGGERVSKSGHGEKESVSRPTSTPNKQRGTFTFALASAHKKGEGGEQQVCLSSLFGLFAFTAVCVPAHSQASSPFPREDECCRRSSLSPTRNVSIYRKYY